MQLSYCQSKTKNDLEQILLLQEKNIWRNVSPETREKEGFVTVEHTFHILERMNKVSPHIIAKHDEKVIGYALCMHPKFANEIKVLQPMFEKINKTIPNIISYIAMGQICIDEDYRKKGVFRKLYETMKKETQQEFDSIVTEVDSKNKRSLEAHFAVGFEKVKSYISGDKEWVIVILE